MTLFAWLLVGGWLGLLIAVTRWPWLIAVGVLLAIRHRIDADPVHGRAVEAAWFEAVRASRAPGCVTARLRRRALGERDSGAADVER